MIFVLLASNSGCAPVYSLQMTMVPPERPCILSLISFTLFFLFLPFPFCTPSSTISQGSPYFIMLSPLSKLILK